MSKQITVILLDRTDSSTDHYVELLREELEHRLKDTRLWVASVEVQPVIDAAIEETAIVKL